MTALVAAVVAATSLHITVWPTGMQGKARSWTLRCAPAAGTLPHAATACRRLAALRHPFRPVPRNAACAQIYGGPQTARVTGRLQGGRVDARFNRRDGCQIERWRRVHFLFPVSVSAGGG